MLLFWIDHREAKVFQFDATDVDHSTVQSTHPHQHLHHKANSGDRRPRHRWTRSFLKHVAQALATAGAILITGPRRRGKPSSPRISSKTQPDLAETDLGCRGRSIIRLTGPWWIFARRFFKADDRMQSANANS